MDSRRLSTLTVIHFPGAHLALKYVMELVTNFVAIGKSDKNTLTTSIIPV